MTYGDLNRRANRLARHLRGLGVGRGVLVGLMVERSLDMVAALIAVLKAGGAYVPLDPSFPEDRLNTMVEDSGMGVLITHRDLDRRLSMPPAAVVRLDVDAETINRLPEENLDSSGPKPQDLAYVLYTSGSTGKPKGVEILQSALVNFLNSMQREPGFRSTDTMLAVTTLSFDIAGLELYLPLVSGGRLVIAGREEAQDPVLLMERIEESGCTVMQATPATWRALVSVGWRGSPRVRILCGGEALPRDLAQELLPRCSALWNMYGPTETTIWSAIHRVLGTDVPIPVGRPIANTQLYVLDAQGGLMPRGSVGELHIGGEGLARGYLARPELTQERFVSSPLAPDGRLYRTGDLARWLPSGTLECLGRIDNQVKIRGYRIELGEVEAVLAQHDGVRQCVAAAYEESPGIKSLVAYFVAHGGRGPEVGDLRASLRKALPDYMVPSVFVPLDKLPLTPNGKIDRRALPPPHATPAVQDAEFAAPRDPLEQALAGIWGRVLGVTRVGLNDNFFDLGGHSLAAVSMLLDVKKLTGRTLPLATLFQAPTVAGLAGLLRKDGWSPSWSSLVPIRPQGARSPLFLVHGAEGNVLLYRRLSHYVPEDYPIYGLQSNGLDGKAALDRSIGEMASRYVKEIMTLQPHGPYVIGGYCMGGTVAMEMAQQLTSAGEKVALVVLLETYNPALFPPARSRLLAPLHFVQNLWFHVANIALLPSKQRLRFLAEKASVELTRMRIRTLSLLHLFSRPKEIALPHLKIRQSNDRAQFDYTPRNYNGRVAVIRSRWHFAGEASPSLGWSELVGEGLEVHELPIYPRGMLVDPFCQTLAEILDRCLRRT